LIISTVEDPSTVDGRSSGLLELDVAFLESSHSTRTALPPDGATTVGAMASTSAKLPSAGQLRTPPVNSTNEKKQKHQMR
jgi:hypothetical protein